MIIPHTRQYYNYPWHLHCCLCITVSRSGCLQMLYYICMRDLSTADFYVKPILWRKGYSGISILFCRNTLHAIIVFICSHLRSMSFGGCYELMHTPLHFCCQCSCDNMCKERQHTRLHLMRTLPEKGNIHYAYFIHWRSPVKHILFHFKTSILL